MELCEIKKKDRAIVKYKELDLGDVFSVIEDDNPNYLDPCMGIEAYDKDNNCKAVSLCSGIVFGVNPEDEVYRLKSKLTYKKYYA